MDNKLIKNLLERFNKLKIERKNVENTWQTIADYCLPNSAEITRSTAGSYTPNPTKVFDGTAIKAVEYLSSELHGGLTNPMIDWFTLKFNQPTSNNRNTEIFLEQCRRVMLNLFNNSASCFPAQNHEFIMSLVSYGTACMYVEDTGYEGIKFSTIHISEVFILEDNYGMIDSVFREFRLTTRQMMQKWGDSNHQKIKDQLDKEPEAKHPIVHVVIPVNDLMKGTHKFHKYVSLYIDIEHNHLISKGGYIEMPYIVARFAKLAGETYGRSPAWQALPEIKMVNKMRETIIRAAQMQSSPPLLVSDDGVMMPLRAVPNGLIMGGLSYDGLPKIQPLNVGGNLGIGVEMLRDSQKAIRDSFFVDQLVFRDGPTMTATEVVQRQQESLRLLAPHLGRLGTEYLTPLIEIVFSMLAMAGKFGDINSFPQEIVKSGYEIDYVGPLALLQRAAKLQQFQQFLGFIGPVAQVSPTVLDNVDFDAALKLIASDLGVWPSIIVDEQVVAEKRAQVQQMQAMQAGLNVTQQIADINRLNPKQ